MEEFGILGFGILNPRHRIQNPGLSSIPLHGVTWGNKAMLSPQMLEFIDDNYLFGQRYLSNEDGSWGRY